MVRLSSTISSVATALLVVVMLIPTSAYAQQPNQRPQPLREAAIALARKAEDNRRPANKLAIPAAQAASTRRRSVGRKILGGAIGATAGLFAGGYLGAVIEGDRCHCDDPGLQGALIGAPIGAVVGAIAGALLF